MAAKNAKAKKPDNDRFNIFERLPAWSPTEQHDAQAEGWDIFDRDSNGCLEIQRLDEADVFETDREAAEHVSNRAAAGSMLHMRALLMIAHRIIVPHYHYQVEGLSDLAADVNRCTNSAEDLLEDTFPKQALGTLYLTNY